MDRNSALASYASRVAYILGRNGDFTGEEQCFLEISYDIGETPAEAADFFLEICPHESC